MGFFSWLFKRKTPKYKLGLALGSGGAKGFAELGVLRAFEENGITFDCVGGTSIGSIISAAYAEGFSSIEITELLKSVDYSEITNLFMIRMDMTGMFKVLDKTLGGKNIEQLVKPYIAIGTEVETGEEKVFSSGNLAEALCASCSIPPFFKPMVIDGKRYVDGAFSNSVPSDRVRELGADYVVAVDLSNHQAKPSMISKFIPTYKGKVEKPWLKGYEFADVMIHPNLNKYQATSFGSWAEMYDIGYASAISVMPQILQDIQLLKNGKYKKLKGKQ